MVSEAKKRFMEAHGITQVDMHKQICECEDFPCCGHAREDRYTTWEALFKEEQREKSRRWRELREEVW